MAIGTDQVDEIFLAYGFTAWVQVTSLTPADVAISVQQASSTALSALSASGRYGLMQTKPDLETIKRRCQHNTVTILTVVGGAHGDAQQHLFHGLRLGPHGSLSLDERDGRTNRPCPTVTKCIGGGLV